MFKILDEVCTPTKESKYSAFVDLYAREDCVIGAGETKIVGLGVCIDEDELDNIFHDMYIANHISNIRRIINIKDKVERDMQNYDETDYMSQYIDDCKKSHYLQLEPQSSLRAKGLVTGTGVIDLDYKDEIKMIIYNPIKSSEILNYIRLAQGLNEESQINTDFKIKKGDKIAQIALMEHKTYLLGTEIEKEEKD